MTNWLWQAYVEWMLGFLRAGALMAVFPVLSSRVIPVRIRLALGGLLAFLVMPWIDAPLVSKLDDFSYVTIVVREVLCGLAMGFISRLVFYSVQLAGSVIAFQMGLQMSSAVDPNTDATTETPGLILYYLAAMIFFSLDLHHVVIAGYIRSYEVVPLGAATMAPGLPDFLVARTSYLFVAAVQMAAPLIAVSFLLTYVFALLGRAVPQMNVFSESFSARLITGLFVFGITLQLSAQHIISYGRRVSGDLATIINLLKTA